jgi:hypothetical protein
VLEEVLSVSFWLVDLLSPEVGVRRYLRREARREVLTWLDHACNVVCGSGGGFLGLVGVGLLGIRSDGLADT